MITILSFLEQDFLALPLDLFNLAFNLLVRQVVSFFGLSFKNIFKSNFFFLEIFDTVFFQTLTLVETFNKIVNEELKKIHNPLATLNKDFLEINQTISLFFSDNFLKKFDHRNFDNLTIFSFKRFFKKFHKIFFNFIRFSDNFLIKEGNSILWLINFLFKIIFSNLDSLSFFKFFDNPFLVKLNNLLTIIDCFQKVDYLRVSSDQLSETSPFLIDKFVNKKFPFLNFSFFLACLRFIRVSYGYPLHFFVSLDKFYAFL